MSKRAILKYFIFLIILSLSFMVILGSPFIYAADLVPDDSPFDVKSSPVGSTDLTKFFNLDGSVSEISLDFVFLRTTNGSHTVSGSAAGVARTWNFTDFNFSSDKNFYCIGATNDGMTLVDGYRYVIKAEILMRSEYSDGSSSLADYTPSLIFYSEFTDSGDYFTTPISASSWVQLENGRRVYTWDFVFDSQSLFVNPFKGDNPTLNEDGTYSFTGYGFMFGRGPADKELTGFRIVWNERKSYVFSPEDYMAYYTLSELWNMGGDKSSWVDESIDEATHESGQILDNLGQMVLPDIDDASGYANPFSQMDPYWFEEFSRILGPIVDNPFITTLIVLAAIFCMLSYVLFGKKV